MGRAATLVFLLTLQAGCDLSKLPRNDVECTTGEDGTPCPEGQVCVETNSGGNECLVLCAQSRECGELEACLDGLCRQYQASCEELEDCADGYYCAEANQQCLKLPLGVSTCDDGVLAGSETDVDCGGDCPACVLGLGCAIESDCETQTCTEGTCSTPACPDCAPGYYCSEVADECLVLPFGVSTCDDEVEAGDETDIDCGGSCNPCEVGDGCEIDADCTSLACAIETCVAPSCPDGRKNGDETAVDCGGSCAIDCPDGQDCLVPADCASGDCAGLVCNSCGDGTERGGEECDDDNNLVEACTYGLTSCVVCGPACTNVPGLVSYCGDGSTDEAHGEICDSGGGNSNDWSLEPHCNVNCSAEAPFCGDGAVAPEEECDDSSDCLIGTHVCAACECRQCGAPDPAPTFGITTSARLAVDGDLAVVCDGGLRVLDVSNPLLPVSIGFLPTPVCTLPGGGSCPTGWSCSDLAISGTVAYWALSSRRLSKVDLSDPSDPVIVDDFLTDVDAIGVGYADPYVLVWGDGSFPYTQYGFEIIDWSGAGAVRLGRFQGTKIPAQVVGAGNLALAALYDEVVVVDISDPADPKQVGSFMRAGARGVVIDAARQLGYVAATSGLVVIDLVEPTIPNEVGAVAFTPSEFIAQAGTFVYVADTASVDVYFHLVDVSDYTAPRLGSTYQAPNTVYDVAVASGVPLLTYYQNVLPVEMCP